ncbi:MAG TPA: hypothetical protein VD767_05430, partial [Thermomicrobiales bacterium]|nr:hypothetical protein [Thermomicrobiales bacterium]
TTAIDVFQRPPRPIWLTWIRVLWWVHVRACDSMVIDPESNHDVERPANVRSTVAAVYRTGRRV